MSNARNLARLLPNTSGQIALPSQVSGVLPDANAPSGSVLQVVQTVKTDTSSTTTASWVDLMSASITPISASSKILILAHVSYSGYNSTPFFKLLRNSTDLTVADAAGSRSRVFAGSHLSSSGTLTFVQYLISNASMHLLDSPNTTSATTYKVQFSENNQAGSASVINRPFADTDATWNPRVVSTLTLLEIAG